MVRVRVGVCSHEAGVVQTLGKGPKKGKQVDSMYKNTSYEDRLKMLNLFKLSKKGDLGGIQLRPLNSLKGLTDKTTDNSSG